MSYLHNLRHDIPCLRVKALIVITSLLVFRHTHFLALGKTAFGKNSQKHKSSFCPYLLSTASTELTSAMSHQING